MPDQPYQGALPALLWDMPEQYKDKPGIAALHAAFARQHDELRQFLLDVLAKCALGSAEGAQLDGEGDIIRLTRMDARMLAATLGLPDDDMGDERYRMFLGFKRLLNANRCTHAEVYGALKTFWPATSFTYVEDQAHPATIIYDVGGQSIAQNREPLALAQMAKAAGVALVLRISEIVEAGEYYAGAYMTVRGIITIPADPGQEVPQPPTVTGVAVTPSAPSMLLNATQQFTATVDGTNSPPQDVAWSMDGATSSSTVLSQGGMLTIGHDEKAAYLTITATSSFNPAYSGAAFVTVLLPVLTSVDVMPQAATVPQGGAQQFAATVNGTNNPPQTIAWAVSGASHANTRIDSLTGVLEVALGEAATSLTITAASTYATSVSGSATAIVVEPAYVWRRTGGIPLQPPMGFSQAGNHGNGQALAVRSDGKALAVGGNAAPYFGYYEYGHPSAPGQWKRFATPAAAPASQIFAAAISPDGVHLAVGTNLYQPQTLIVYRIDHAGATLSPLDIEQPTADVGALSYNDCGTRLYMGGAARTFIANPTITGYARAGDAYARINPIVGNMPYYWETNDLRESPDGAHLINATRMYSSSPPAVSPVLTAHYGTGFANYTTIATSETTEAFHGLAYCNGGATLAAVAREGVFFFKRDGDSYSLDFKVERPNDIGARDFDISPGGGNMLVAAGDMTHGQHGLELYTSHEGGYILHDTIGQQPQNTVMAAKFLSDRQFVVGEDGASELHVYTRDDGT